MKLPIIASLAVALLTIGHRAAAQGQDQFAIGVSGGVAVATDDLKQYHTNGVNGGLSLAIGAVDAPVGVRLDLMYNAFGDREGASTQRDQGKARIIALTGNVVFNLYGGSNRLYAIAGLGGYNYRPDGAGTVDATDFGLNGGLGFWIPRVNGFVEARFHNFYSALPDPADPTMLNRSARFYPITFGVLF